MKLIKQSVLRDLQSWQLLISLITLIPIIWWLVLGWTPSHLIDQHDNLHQGYVYLQQLERAAGDWTKFLYWPQLTGGVKVHDVTGSLPIVQLLAYMGASPLIISNLSVFFVQVLFAYFCTRSVLCLTQIAFNNKEATPYIVLVLIGILFAFLPLLGWRLSYGHQNIVYGLFVFLCMTSLLLDEICDRRSMVSLLLALVALTHTFQFSGYQLIHYSVVFGAPLILALVVANPGQSHLHRLGWFVFPTLVFLAALLISLPKFTGMLANALSDEMGRSVYNSVIYSYTIATVRDWISSIPWSAGFIPDARQAFTYQEVNYPLGPVVLLLFLVKPTTPLIRLYIGLGLSLFLALVVSMNIKPLSNLLTSTIPLLESFRVPARSILPFLLFLTMTSAAALLKLIAEAGKHHHPDGSPGSRETFLPDPGPARWQPILLAIVAVAFFAYSSPLINDIALALLVAATFWLVKKKKYRGEIALLTLALFTGGAIAAFSERINPPLQDPISSAAISPIVELIAEQAPWLDQPLNRVYTNIHLKGIAFNSSFFMDISSLSGYWFPLRRYAQLEAALNNKPYRAAVSVFNNPPSREGFEILNRLYNVAWVIEYIDGKPQVRDLAKTRGKAWFSDEIKWEQTLTGLAKTLKGNTQGGHNEILLLASDQATAPVLSVDTHCVASNVEEVNDTRSFFPLKINVIVKGQCLLTLAMNYSSIFKAVNQDGSGLITFPAYGALLGIVVGEDTTMISIAPEVTTFPGVYFTWIAGGLLALAMILYLLRTPLASGLVPTQYQRAETRLRSNPVLLEAGAWLWTRLGRLQMVAILVITAGCYHQVLSHHFVWDTIPFVLGNPWLQEMNWGNLVSIFTEAHRANWQPLVWLSHSLDFQLFGMDAGKHHLVNLILHTANAILFYLLILFLTSRTKKFSMGEKKWIAFIGALIFAIHPQHVESVAWVVERKDVLYSLFAISTLIAYLRLHNLHSPTKRDKLLPFVLFILAITSKSMAVTLPVALVMLDFYPLSRCNLNRQDLFAAILEKWHYILIALCVVLITLNTQSMAMATIEQLPAWVRSLNALDNSWFYIAHYLLPTQLSPLYPYPDATVIASPAFWIDGAVFLVLSISICSWLWWRQVRWPALLLLFYLITLLPVAGFIHVGPAKATDHYTYLATLPLSLLTGIVVVFAIRHLKKYRAVFTGLIVFYCLFLFLITYQQVTYWNNPLVLWSRVIQLYPASALAHRNLASAYYSIGEGTRALEHATRSLQLGGPVDDYLRQLREAERSK